MRTTATWLPALVGLMLSSACGGGPLRDDGGEDTGDDASELACSAELLCPVASVCMLGACVPTNGRRPYRDSWRTELTLPAATFDRLIIGGRASMDNFVNRGDIEILYADEGDTITVEVQRFTVTSSFEDAEDAFGRMSLWAYALDEVARPDEAIAQARCDQVEPADQGDQGDQGSCQLRAYYDGLFQPLRDGMNFRVTLPRGWAGALELVTEDNLEEGDYPDRGDIRVDALAGHLRAELDSGVAEIRLDSNYMPFPGCPANDSCIELGYEPGCGCSEFGNVRVDTRDGRAADITVDVPPWNFYDVNLQNDDAMLELGCSVEIDCEAFEDCALDPDFVDVAAIERAALNYPGPPAIPGSGILVDLHAGACASIEHAERPADYFEGAAVDVRGGVRLCSGCL